jgi:hypothetical protein
MMARETKAAMKDVIAGRKKKSLACRKVELQR